MEIEEAREILKVRAGADQTEIEDAWNRAIRGAHPDGNGEGASDGRAAEVNVARDILKAAASANTNMVLREVVGELALLRAEGAKRQVSEQTLRRIVTHHVGKLAEKRRQRVVTAIASGGVAALLGLVSALGKFPEPFDTFQGLLALIAVGIAIVAASIGIRAWAVASTERLLELEIQEANEFLSDREDFASTLNEIGACGFFDRQRLQSAVERWKTEPPSRNLRGSPRSARPLTETAGRIGAVDFVRLLLAKGIELGMLKEAEGDVDGQLTYGYRRC